MKQEQHPSTEKLIDYIHRELSPEDDAAILMHVESCDECRARYQLEARLSESLRVHARETERELPQGVVNGIWAAIESPPQPSLADRLRALFRPAVAVPVTAVAALAIYFGVTATHHAGSTTMIDAAYYLDDHAALTSTVPFGEGNAVPTQLESDQTNSDVVAVSNTTVMTADVAR